MTRTMLLLATGLLMASCASFDRITPVPVFTCPTLKQYSKDSQAKAADEIDAHGDKVPILVDLVGDYRNLRAGIRKACPGR